MKLSAALAFALALCFGSLVARAAIVHRRDQRAAEVALQASRESLATRAEKLVLAGLDTRLHARLRRLAAR